MLNWLKKIISNEVVEAVRGLPLPRRRGVNGGTSSPERYDPKRRRTVWLQDLKARVASRVHVYPPQRGHRRSEWSSAVPGRWSTLNGLPEGEL